MKETILIEERNGTPLEVARLAHQHIITGLAMAGYRVSSKEGKSYSGRTGKDTASITIEFEFIPKDEYGNEIKLKERINNPTNLCVDNGDALDDAKHFPSKLEIAEKALEKTLIHIEKDGPLYIETLIRETLKQLRE